MIELRDTEVTLLQFESLANQQGLAHGFTTRPQNYAPHRGRGSDQAVRWRRKACEMLGLPFERLTSPQQVHGAEVLRVEECDIGCGHDGRGSALRFVDGLVCHLPEAPLILLSADCPLVCVYDPKRPAIGAVHASWQGTVARSVEQMIRVMRREFGTDPSKLVAAISPSAGPCCYEVGEEVRRIARTRLTDPDKCFVRRNGKLMFDMWRANRRQLMECGLSPDQIEVAGLCSICDQRFWSHRRDGAEAGRSALVIGLKT